MGIFFDVQITCFNPCLRKHHLTPRDELSMLPCTYISQATCQPWPRPSDTTRYAGPNMMPLLLPSLHPCVPRIEVRRPRPFGGGDGNIFVWESSPLAKHRGVGKTLALDFPVTFLWTSCPRPALWWAGAETRHAVTFPSSTPANGDRFEVKTINMRPGQNLKHNLHLPGMQNF